jgi:hypothetical protein
MRRSFTLGVIWIGFLILSVLDAPALATDDPVLFSKYQNLCDSFRSGVPPALSFLGCSVLRFSPMAMQHQVVETVDSLCRVHIAPMCSNHEPDAMGVAEGLDCPRFGVDCERLMRGDRTVQRHLGRPATEEQFRERLKTALASIQVSEAYQRWLGLEKEREAMEAHLVSELRRSEDGQALRDLIDSAKKTDELVRAIRSAALAAFIEEEAVSYVFEKATEIPDAGETNDAELLKVKASEAEEAFKRFIGALAQIDPDLADFLSPSLRVLDELTVQPFLPHIDPFAGESVIRAPIPQN